jgi:uncharacterized membrane protein YdbT with pleckstrin-like domain
VEEVRFEERRHGIVLAGAFGRALALAAPGVLAVVVGWPATVLGAGLLTVAAFIAVRAVWKWDRTRVVVTDNKLLVVHGTLRRRTAATGLGAVEIEQGILGRLLGYGTIVAGDLEVTHVPEPRRVVERLSA